MTLLVPDVGEVALLDMALSDAAPEAQTLSLYTSNTTPAEGDTAATYTIATGSGSDAKTLARATWNAASTAAGTTSKTYPAQVFSFTGSFTVYGYLIRKVTAGTLLWSEKVYGSGQAFVSGDSLTITPRIELA
ncbi:MAG: hypothetical protein RL030_2800 [Pseudomonadota bacterium]